MRNVFQLILVILLVTYLSGCNGFSNTIEAQSNKTQNITTSSNNANSLTEQREKEQGYNVTTNSKDPNPLSQAKVEGNFRMLNLSDAKIETILAHPAPQISLVFSCKESGITNEPCNDGNYKIELPAETNTDLNHFWKEINKIRYENNIENPPGTVYYENMKKIFNLSTNFAERLKKIYINTPDGLRLISEKEALDVIYFINNSSVSLVKQTEQIRNQ